MGGSIERYHKAMGGNTGASAAKKAARQQISALDKSYGFLTDREKDILSGYDQYIDAGRGAWDEMVRGSSIEGFGNRLSDVMGSQFYDELKGERISDASRYLSSQGIGRSSAGAESIGDIGMDTAMGLEAMLMGRTGNIAGQGYNALNTQTGYKDAYGRALADMITRRGALEATGTLGAAQAEIQGQQNRYNAMHNVGSSLMGMFGGGMGGGSDLEMGTGIDPNTYNQQGAQSQPFEYGNYSLNSNYNPSLGTNQGNYSPYDLGYWDNPVYNSDPNYVNTGYGYDDYTWASRR